MNGSNQPVYSLGEIVVDPARGCVRRDGVEQYLRPKTLQVLVYLIQQRQRLVTKDELMSELWRGTAVTDDALVQSIVEIRRVFNDDSRRPRYIKTFPKVGYHFIGPVEELKTARVELEDVTSIEIEVEEEIREQVEGPRRWLASPLLSKRRWTIVILAIGVMIAVAGLWAWFNLDEQTRHAEVVLPPMPGKRALAVMFFENQSASSELDWLREGLADMLITDLSRSRRVTVLSRQQLHLLLERNRSSRADAIGLDEALEISRDSQADVVLLGSFARLGEKIRIDAKLHDAKNGQLIAAESLTLHRPDQILTEIDLLSLKLAAHLGSSTAEQPRTSDLASVTTNNLEAYRCYSLALEKAPALDNTEAIALLERAIALDPEFAMAYARIGYAYAVTWDFGKKAKPYLERAFQLSHRLTEKDRLYIAAWYAISNQDFPGAVKPLREVIALNPREIEAYWRLGCLLEGEDQFQEAIDVLRQAVAIDPEAKDIFNTLGFLNADLGRHDDAVAMINRHIALTPDEPNAHNSLGLIYDWAGRYEEAIAAYEKSLALKPDFDLATVHLGNTYFHQGRYQKAIEQYQRYIQIARSQMERARGYGRIAWVFWKKGDRARAEENARRELSLEPTAVYNSVVLALDRGDFTRPGQLMQETKKFSYTSRGARTSQRYPAFFNAWIAFKTDRVEEALAGFKQTLRHRPPIWATDAYEDCLANAYLDLGREDEAIAEYERVLRLNPNYPLAQYRLGRAYDAKGDRERARTAYRSFLQVWKDADLDINEVIDAKARLGTLISSR